MPYEFLLQSLGFCFMMFSVLSRPKSIISAFAALVLNVDARDSVVVFNEIHYNPNGGDVEYVEIYNQNATPIDLTSWRISGGIDFQFPDDLRLNGHSYMVIASDPVAFTTAVQGPYTGRLGNGGERIRLRNNNDRIMDEVEYNDRQPWPVGADGTGASLAKIRPDTRSDLPELWAASHQFNGTPGVANFETGATGEAVAGLTINEIPNGGTFPYWVELHYEGESAVNLGDYILSFEDAGTFALAEGVTISPGATLLVPIPEEALTSIPLDEETLVLYSPDGLTVQDSVRVGDNGKARFPDGAAFFKIGPSSPGSALTPGAANNIVLQEAIVINEIMYNHRPQYADLNAVPPVPFLGNDEEWIELYNRSEQAVVLDGWELAGAVRYTFPLNTNTRLEPGEYLIVARDRATFTAKYPSVPLAPADYAGSLSNRGEKLTLHDAIGNLADLVSYYDDDPWPSNADGQGSSMELTDPGRDNSLPSAWRASENEATWQNYEFTITAQTPTEAPPQNNFHEVRLGLLDEGVILLDDFSVIENPNGTARELIANNTFENIDGWRLLGTHQNSAVVDDAGENVLRVEASATFNYLNNLIESNLTQGGSLRPIIAGTDYKVSFRAKWVSGTPQFRFEFYYNKLARLVILDQPDLHGTPGARNSTFTEASGPDLSMLVHQPAVPRPSEAVTVSVAAQDPDGVNLMTLNYSVDNNAIVQFYVEARDGNGNGSFAPPLGPDSGALYKVTNPVFRSTTDELRIVMSEGNISEQEDRDNILDNQRRFCTIILNENEPIYDCEMRLRGSMFSRRFLDRTGLNLKFPSDQRYRGIQSTVIVKRDRMVEILAKHVINAAGGIHSSYNDVILGGSG